MPSLNTDNAILSNAIKVNSSYNVGIGGAASGSFKLQVTGTSNLTGALSGTSATFSGEIKSGDTITLGTAAIGGFWTWGASTTFLVAATGKALNLNPNGTSGSTGLSIATTGAATFSSRVTANDFVFTGSGAVFQNIASAGTSPIYGYFQNSGGVFYFGRENSAGTEFGVTAYSTVLWNTGNNPIVFATAGSQKMTILGNGNVGIGTSSPANILTVQANDTFNQDNSGQLVLRGASNTSKRLGVGFDTTNNYGYVQAIEAGVSTRPFVLQPFGGNVLIGTTSNPSNYRFLVNTTAYIKSFLAFGTSTDNMFVGQGDQISGAFAAGDLTLANFATSGRVVITNVATGVFLANGATSWSTYSDERLKNINGNIENAIEKLSNIRAVKYSWKKDETNKENLGLIAQDIDKVLPQVIEKSKAFDENDDTEYLSVRYTELIPVLVKAIQEQQAQIEAQQQQINSLINR
jgi:hypothetical protein